LEKLINSITKIGKEEYDNTEEKEEEREYVLSKF